MKEIAFQKIKGVAVPFSDEDKELFSEYKENQVLKSKINGVKKQRSYLQLKMFWALCKKVAGNTDDKSWNSPKKVALQIKIDLRYYDNDLIIVKPDGEVYMPLRSISYKDLPHMEACNFFDRAWVVMAKFLGITVDELLTSQGDVE